MKNHQLGFRYFCITTEELLRTRDLSMCPTEMPHCTATRANYYYHNGLVLETYDLQQIKAFAKTAAANHSTMFTLKCKHEEVYREAFQKLCADGEDCYSALRAAAKIDKSIQTTAYSYSYDPRLRVITVRFKHK